MTTRVVYLVVCAAPPAQAISELVALLKEQDWTVCVITTLRAAGWVDTKGLTEQTGYPVRHDHKGPDDPGVSPMADTIVVVPATFNTINKWANGISDNFALGLLNEAVGLRLPTIVAPYAKPTLAAHPAFGPNLKTLNEWGVTVLANEAIRPELAGHPFDWRPVLEAMPPKLSC